MGEQPLRLQPVTISQGSIVSNPQVKLFSHGLSILASKHLKGRFGPRVSDVFCTKGGLSGRPVSDVFCTKGGRLGPRVSDVTFFKVV